MKRVFICLLTMVTWAGTARAQDVDSWQDFADAPVVDAADLTGSAQNSYSWWASSELLLWWTKAGPAPVPLATTAPASSTAFFPGALNNPDTTVVLGGSRIAHPAQLGGRFNVGSWFSGDSPLGAEASFLFLSTSTVSNTVSDNGSQFLTNPFNAFLFPSLQLPAANFLTVPGYPNYGSATLATIRQVYGAELNGLWSLRENGGQSWQLLGGYRFFNLNEELSLDTVQQDNVFFFPGQFLTTNDRFQTRNYFNGGQIGIRNQWTWGALSLASTIKLAVGATTEIVDIRGSTTTNGFFAPGPVTTVPGGIYTQQTNIGKYQFNRFALLPEATFRLGLQITPRIRTFVGYNFLYLSNVVRPGNQIDGSINPSQLVSFTGLPRIPLFGDPRPLPQLQTTDFWVQGLTLGAEFVW